MKKTLSDPWDQDARGHRTKITPEYTTHREVRSRHKVTIGDRLIIFQYTYVIQSLPRIRCYRYFIQRRFFFLQFAILNKMKIFLFLYVKRLLICKYKYALALICKTKKKSFIAICIPFLWVFSLYTFRSYIDDDTGKKSVLIIIFNSNRHTMYVYI